MLKGLKYIRTSSADCAAVKIGSFRDEKQPTAGHKSHVNSHMAAHMPMKSSHTTFDGSQVSVLQPDASGGDPDHVTGQRLSRNSPVPQNRSLGRSPEQMTGQAQLQRSPPPPHLAPSTSPRLNCRRALVTRSISPQHAQQAAMFKQKPEAVTAQQAMIKQEPWEEELGHKTQQQQEQSSWQGQVHIEQGSSLPQYTQHADPFLPPNPRLNGSDPPVPAAPGHRYGVPLSQPPPPPFSRGFTLTSQSLSHAQRLSPDPIDFADAEAQLFFNRQPGLLSPLTQYGNQIRAVTHHEPMHPFIPQQYHQQLQQQQHQKLQLQQQVLQQCRQQHQMHSQQFQHSPEDPPQRPWIPHQLPPNVAAAHQPPHSAFPASHSNFPAAQRQQPMLVRSSSNPMQAWSSPMQAFPPAQQAQHGANGYPKQQQSMPGGAHAQQAQHASSNGSMQGNSRGSSGSKSSTAFIVWVDAQFKSRGLTGKRAALRQFVQDARVSSTYSFVHRTRVFPIGQIHTYVDLKP